MTTRSSITLLLLFSLLQATLVFSTTTKTPPVNFICSMGQDLTEFCKRFSYFLGKEELDRQERKWLLGISMKWNLQGLNTFDSMFNSTVATFSCKRSKKNLKITWLEGSITKSAKQQNKAKLLHFEQRNSSMGYTLQNEDGLKLSMVEPDSQIEPVILLNVVGKWTWLLRICLNNGDDKLNPLFYVTFVAEDVDQNCTNVVETWVNSTYLRSFLNRDDIEVMKCPKRVALTDVQLQLLDLAKSNHMLYIVALVICALVLGVAALGYRSMKRTQQQQAQPSSTQNQTTAE